MNDSNGLNERKDFDLFVFLLHRMEWCATKIVNADENDENDEFHS